jgi:hypothetical protein
MNLKNDFDNFAAISDSTLTCGITATITKSFPPQFHRYGTLVIYIGTVVPYGTETKSKITDWEIK